MERKRLFGLNPDNTVTWHKASESLHRKETRFRYVQQDTAKLDSIYNAGMTEEIFGNLEPHIPIRTRVLGLKHLSGKK